MRVGGINQKTDCTLPHSQFIIFDVLRTQPLFRHCYNGNAQAQVNTITLLHNYILMDDGEDSYCLQCNVYASFKPEK